ncbi:hypothetical protein [Streptosporangium nondiastaticum]|uniref:hypothetical protein n=1 Tax=Streptosporangium nondiastaticum TaxID=35764 RepID=UPI0011B23F06|nr:hypothetical protein [Streptosporangium nondiastaticum]
MTNELVFQVIEEVAAKGEFGVVLANAPEELQTAFVPEPGAGFIRQQATMDPRQLHIATAGIVLRRNGGWCATTARHSLLQGSTFLPRVEIGATTGRVCADDLVTDSCLVALDSDPRIPSAADYAGVRRCIMPAMGAGERAWFCRVDEPGRVGAVVHGVDASILEPQQDFASLVYTDPVTRTGDSGVALLDSQNRMVGFAVRRTSIRAPIVQSYWIYAEQALSALGVLEEADELVE